MPTYEYSCPDCQVIFEEILLSPDDVKLYAKEHPCVRCKKPAPRIEISLTNFSFKAPPGQTQGSGVHGQSGVHDLDNPSLDKAIGRSSEKKWTEFHRRKAERDKVRKSAGTNAISTAGGVTTPVAGGVLKTRETGLKTFSKRPRPPKP